MANVAQFDGERSSSATPAEALGARRIADKLFVDQLNYVRDVIDFLIRRQVDLSKQSEDLNALAALGTVRYSRRGQPANQQDWKNLYQLSHSFISQLTDDRATSFAVWQTRGFYGLLPFAFFVGALIALALTFFTPRIINPAAPDIRGLESVGRFVSILLWTCSLGGLGVSAFFGTSLLTQLASENGTNAAKWKERITDKNYLRTRLTLGILFAFVIGLPFGFSSLWAASETLWQPPASDKMLNLLLQILAPFLFGFSTTLVLAVLERVIEGIRTTLGVQSNR